jgi:hypothetical protein
MLSHDLVVSLFPFSPHPLHALLLFLIFFVTLDAIHKPDNAHDQE